MTNSNQVQQFQRDGFFLVENLVSQNEIDAILRRMEEYVREERPRPPGFSLQLEPRVARGEVTVADKMTAVRKIKETVPGDDLLTKLVCTPRLVTAMESIMGTGLKLYRADFLMKPPRVGSAKGVHQDSPYWPLEPYDLASCWIAFDDATRENGCMTVIPGSHCRGAVPHVSVPDDMVIPTEHYREGDLVHVEMKAGTGLVFHSLLIHGTAPNTSPRPRRAITVSCIARHTRYTRTNSNGHDFGPEPEYFPIQAAGR